MGDIRSLTCGGRDALVRAFDDIANCVCVLMGRAKGRIDDDPTMSAEFDLSTHETDLWAAPELEYRPAHIESPACPSAQLGDVHSLEVVGSDERLKRPPCELRDPGIRSKALGDVSPGGQPR